jgi:hypothetical protein
LKIKYLFTFFIVSIILFVQIGFCLGSWEEVISFSGSGDDYLDTGRITLDYAEWRIVWDYQPDPETPDLSMFVIDVYEKQEDGPFLSIFDLKGENLQGSENVVNKTGDFYMIIETNNVTQYSVVIQQNLDSIPEFTGIWLVMPFLMFIVPLLLFRKKII